MIVRQNPANVPEEKPVKACKDILKFFFYFFHLSIVYGHFLIGLPGHHLASLKTDVIAENSLNCICSNVPSINIKLRCREHQSLRVLNYLRKIYGLKMPGYLNKKS
jgi:hypothetical protein